jgi:hypothetical protein
MYIHHINYDCPMRDAYAGSSTVDSEPVEDSSQDSGADYSEPVVEDVPDPVVYDEPVDYGSQDSGADYSEPVDYGPQDSGADYSEPIDDSPQDPYAE